MSKAPRQGRSLRRVLAVARLGAGVSMIAAAGCGAGTSPERVAARHSVSGSVWHHRGVWGQGSSHYVALALDGTKPPYRIVDAEIRWLDEPGGQTAEVTVGRCTSNPWSGTHVVWLESATDVVGVRFFYRTDDRACGATKTSTRLCRVFSHPGPWDQTIGRDSPFAKTPFLQESGAADIVASAFSVGLTVAVPRFPEWPTGNEAPKFARAEAPLFVCDHSYGVLLRTCLDPSRRERVPARPLALLDAPVGERVSAAFYPRAPEPCAPQAATRGEPIAAYRTVDSLALCEKSSFLDAKTHSPTRLQTWSTTDLVPTGNEWARVAMATGHAVALHPQRASDEPAVTVGGPVLERCRESGGGVRLVWEASFQTRYPPRCKLDAPIHVRDRPTDAYLVPHGAEVRGYGITRVETPGLCPDESRRRMEDYDDTPVPQ